MTDMNYESLTDEELNSLAMTGDELAEEALIGRYKEFVKYRTRPYFLMGGDREDIIQEGMIGLFRAMRDYSPDRNMGFRSFAALCIERQVISAIKGAARKKHQPLNSYVSLYTDEDSPDRPLIDSLMVVCDSDPQDIMISEESISGLSVMLSNMLTPLEKQVLALYLDGLSYQDIAAKLGRSRKCVDNCLRRIKQKIARYKHEYSR